MDRISDFICASLAISPGARAIWMMQSLVSCCRSVELAQKKNNRRAPTLPRTSISALLRTALSNPSRRSLIFATSTFCSALCGAGAASELGGGEHHGGGERKPTTRNK
jgi:hypothetical protein